MAATTFTSPFATTALTSATYNTGNYYNTLAATDETDTLGTLDSALRTDAEFYSDGTADLTAALDGSYETATLFDADTGDDWLTSDLGVESIFADMNTLELATF